MLLQGPPGTGKTHTIIGLLHKLVEDIHPKILVTAPSNAAVDEIGNRLVHLNSQLKIVRVGIPNQINQNMLQYSLEEKAKKMHEEYEIKYKYEEIETLQSEIDRDKHKEDHKTEERIKILAKQIKMIKQQISTLKADYYRKRRQYQETVLKESDIIMSTLGSCCHSIVKTVYGPNSRNPFTCCILDEASQCTEIEALQVLNFGISKLILIGDPQQLPATVSSKFAANYGFDRSLMERFHEYFSKDEKNNPIYMLTEQFRMHSEICRFPSKQFYRNLLVTSAKTDISYKAFPIEPYMVFNIINSQESDYDSSKTNEKEANATARICEQLLGLNAEPKPSIGIITPYAAQRTLYKNLLNKPTYKHIEINTVDGFQGREKDVIIVSCVRANSKNGKIGFLSCKKRLNVAVTRAKYCLIIIGQINTLNQDPNWRELIKDADKRNCLKNVTCLDEIKLVKKNASRK
ncbi:hypothetical protein JTE90_012019 [Oedothorax gibbosus]|uniref:UvrD-like helicase ATP-binding domain-containing protein n=1 Tax=Oedothorax gibbosus TaxID=931172 RepID=A0AAV6TKI4_9ARAC|nr:hypothetical protein JTE90_012019 [Oedothorax gibbosus]